MSSAPSLLRQVRIKTQRQLVGLGKAEWVLFQGVISTTQGATLEEIVSSRGIFSRGGSSMYQYALLHGVSIVCSAS